MEEERLGAETPGEFSQRTKRKKLFFCAAVIIVALLFATGCFFIGMLIGRGGLDEQERSLLWMVDEVQAQYREEVGRDELFDRLYDSLALDKFCAHYSPEEYSTKLEESNGRNKGYGVSFIAEGNAVRVFRVVGNSPADLAGVKRGMYVFACGGKALSSSAEAAELVSSAEGDAVLTCGRQSDGADARDYTLHGAPYRAAYCAYADSEGAFSFRGSDRLVLTQTGEGMSELPADTAYISLSRFEGTAAEEFRVCLANMRSRGRTNLVIDLRGNGGGYLSVLCGIASHLLRNAEGNNPLVLQARHRSGQTENYLATGNDFSSYFGEDSHVSVLADENSASASEALIGALIDYGTCGFSDVYLHKGEGVAATYGKGVMQSHIKAADGNVLLLTVADIFWPKGRCIHGVGITESDGAVGVRQPSLPGAEDAFLRDVCAMLA